MDRVCRREGRDRRMIQEGLCAAAAAQASIRRSLGIAGCDQNLSAPWNEEPAPRKGRRGACTVHFVSARQVDSSGAAAGAASRRTQEHFRPQRASPMRVKILIGPCATPAPFRCVARWNRHEKNGLTAIAIPDPLGANLRSGLEVRKDGSTRRDQRGKRLRRH